MLVSVRNAFGNTVQIGFGCDSVTRALVELNRDAYGKTFVSDKRRSVSLLIRPEPRTMPQNSAFDVALTNWSRTNSNRRVVWTKSTSRQWIIGKLIAIAIA